MIKTIGNKQEFAVELEIERLNPKPLGKLRLWLGGVFIGSFEDSHFLNVSLHQIKSVLNRSLSNMHYINLGPEEAFSEIKKLGLGEYFLNIGESFDDFSVVIYEHDGSYHFVWRLHDEPFFEYPEYPTDIQSYAVSREVLTRVISGAQALIDAKTH
jgi:hypothetical protein